MVNKFTLFSYLEFLNNLKNRIAASRCEPTFNVRRELILLYHYIGQEILRSQIQNNWGVEIFDQLSYDLQSAFPKMKGFSTRNLKYMRKFAKEHPDIEFAAQLTWYHNITLLDKVPRKEDRMFYMKQAIKHGWSRKAMVSRIEISIHNDLS